MFDIDEEWIYSVDELWGPYDRLFPKQNPSILEKVGGKVANAFTSRFKARLKLAKASGIIIFLSNEDLINLAEYYLDAGKTEKVVDTVSIILNRKPDQSDALFHRACSLMLLEQYAESIKDFSRLISLKFEVAFSYQRRSICKLELKDFSGAKKDASKVFEFEINNYIAIGALSVLSKIAKVENDSAKAAKIENRIDKISQFPDNIYIDTSELLR